MLKHNKKRNVGIVFELLSSKFASNISCNDVKSSKIVINVLKEYFFPKSILRKELNVFNCIVENFYENENVSRQVLKTIRDHFEKHSKNKEYNDALDISKTNLVCEISSLFGESFFDKKVKNYKLLASVDILLNHYKNIKNISKIDQVRLEENLIKQMLTEKVVLVESINFEKSNIDSDMKDIVKNMFLKRFNKKYSILNEKHKEFLYEYIMNLTCDKNNLKVFLLNEIGKINIFMNKLNFDKFILENEYFEDKLKQSQSVLLEIKRNVTNNDINDVSLNKIMSFISLMEEFNEKRC